MATRNPLNTAAATLALAGLLALAGCDVEDEDKKSGGLVANHVTGSVGDGPIVGARLRVFANNGDLVMEGQSSDTADYNIFIETLEKNYPLTLEADQGIDLVTGSPPDFSLVSGITSPNDRTTSNLNPYTTLIVSTARRWGTIDESHVVFVRDAVLARYGFGLDTELVPEPTGTPIDEGNVHAVVKSSEAMAERLPEGIDSVLEAAVSEAALADEPTIATVNTTARNTPRSSGNELQPPPPPPAVPPPSEPPPESPPPPVNPGENTPPTVSGTPDTTARVNVAWSFLPTAQDADGDKLTFSVMNKPAWLSFDETTGRLWGKPTIEHVGNHLQIRISVSDGKESASLPAFDLVVEAPSGTATVSWAAPTEREDGSALGSVDQYKVYYGTSRSSLDQVATVSGTTTSHKVEGLAAGTWYFAVTATDDQGLESEKSAIGSKTIR